MSKLLLDVRGNKRATRRVLGHYDLGSRVWRGVGFLYEDYLWIAKGDGSVVKRGERVGFADREFTDDTSGKRVYVFKELISVESLSVDYDLINGCRIEVNSGDEISFDVDVIRYLGVEFYVSSNKDRVRFDNLSGELLKGGEPYIESRWDGVRVIESGLGLGVDRVLIVGGGTVYTDILLVEDLEGYVGGENIVRDSNGRIRILEQGLEGNDVYVFGSDLGGEGLVTGSYLSPMINEDEYLLLRDDFGGGIVDVVYSLGELGRGKIFYNRLTGEIVRGEGVSNRIIYEGVIVGESKSFDSISGITNGGTIPVRSVMNESGLSNEIDGSGLEPSGINPTLYGVGDGSGLMKLLEAKESCFFFDGEGNYYPIEEVEYFPKKYLTDRVYFRRGVVKWNRSLGNALQFVQSLFPIYDGGNNIISGVVLSLMGVEVKGYESIPLGADIGGSKVSRDVRFNFLNFSDLRLDFSNGDGFSVGGDSILTEGVDYDLRLDDNKIEWLSSGVRSGFAEKRIGEIDVDLGLKRVSSFQLFQNGLSEVLTEGEDFDLPLDGLKGSVRLISVIGGEVENQLGSEYVSSIEGDWYEFNDGFYRKGVSGGGLSSSVGLDQSGRYSRYDGSSPYLLLNDERFIPVEITDQKSVLVYRVVSQLKKEDLTSFSEIRSTEGLVSVIYSEQITDGILDINDAHVLSGDYVLKLNDVVLISGVDYTVDLATGKISGSNLEGVLIYEPTALNGEIRYSDLSTPIVSDEFYLLDPQINFEASTGTITLEKSLRVGEGVKINYALNNSQRAEERVGFVISQEECVLTEGVLYSFNPSGLELFPNTSIRVQVGSEILGYGGSTTARLIGNNTIQIPFISSEKVTITYVVSTSLGGDQILKVTSPIYDPQIQIPQGGSGIQVDRDLSGLISVGSILRFDTHCFSVQSISQDGKVIQFTSPSRYFVQGKMELLDTDIDPFISYNGLNLVSLPKGNEFSIEGDMKSTFLEDMILILGGEIHMVRKVEIKEGKTILTVDGYSNGVETSNFLLSSRSVKNKGDRILRSRSAFVLDKPYELIKYQNNLGEKLIKEVDYSVSSETGEITLLKSHQVDSNISYYLFHTSLSTIEPKVIDGGYLSYPSYRIEYVKSEGKAEYDGFNLTSNKQVRESRDFFFLRAVEESEYKKELVEEIRLREGTSNDDTFKPNLKVKQGQSIGVFDLLAEDVISRNEIQFYDGLVSSVDDLTSTMTGSFVGDLDGKFKFDLEVSGEYGGAGLEDPITREIQPRYVFLETLGDGYYHPDDPFTSSSSLRELQDAQRLLISNEMDDIVCTGVKSFTEITLNFPFYETQTIPIHTPMWKPSVFSRLYPQKNEMFTGLYNPPYTNEFYGSIIGQVENGSRGEIKSISSMTLTKRKSRFRVWAYSPTGFDQFPQTKNKFSLILSAVDFKDFPFNDDGTVDTSQFISEGGNIFDVISGNIDLKFSGLTVGTPLQVGKYNLGTSPIIDDVEDGNNFSSLTDLFSQFTVNPAPRKVRVKEIISGCVITLGVYDSNKNLINPSSVRAFGSDLSLDKGDTLIESFTGDLDEETPPSVIYRVGTDIGLNSITGELINITLPSLEDPSFPIKEIAGQFVPPSNSFVEGDVYFSNTDLDPFLYPALNGEGLNDSGDYSIPYLKRSSEKDLLPQMAGAINTVLTSTTNGEYLYVDEIRDVGDIQGGYVTVNKSLTPFSDGEVASSDVEQGDLILVELEEAPYSNTASSTGFLEISKVNGNQIYVPRFHSPIPQNRGIFYLFSDVYVHDADDLGFYVEESQVGNTYSTTLHRPSSNDLDFTDLESATISNPNTNGTDNFIYFKIYEQGSSVLISDGSFKLKKVANGWEVITSTGTVSLTNVIFNADSIVMETQGSGWFDFNATNLALVNPTTTERHPCSFDVDFHTGGSYTASIGDDRLTFSEAFTLSIRDKDNALDSFLDISFCGEEVFEIGGAGTQIILSNFNDTNLLNDGEFKFISNQSGTSVEVPSFYGHANTEINRQDQKLSIWCSSKVDSSSEILSGVGEINGYDVNLNQNVSSNLIRMNSIATGSLSQVRIDDLVHISTGHFTGTYRINHVHTGNEDYEHTGVLGDPSNSSHVGNDLEFYTISSISDNGDGTYNLTVNQTINQDQFTGAGGVSPLALVVDLTSYTSEPPTNTSILYCHYESITGDTFERLGYVDYANHPFVDGRHQQVSFANFGTFVNDAIASGDHIVTGQNVISAPSYFLENQDFPFELREWGNGVGFALKVVSSQTHNGEHNPYYFDITGVNRGVDNGIESVIIDVSNPPTVGTPNNFYVSLLPNDQVSIAIKVYEGLYIDPLFPRTNQKLNAPNPNYYGTSLNHGTPRFSEYNLSNLPAYNFTSRSEIRVKRLRRFTNVLSLLNDALKDFSYLYKERTGVVSSLTSQNNTLILTPTKVDGKDTVVGDFSDLVFKGDKVLFYDAQGVETLRTRVVSVSTTLSLKIINGNKDLTHSTFKVISKSGLISEIQSFNLFVEHTLTESFKGNTGKVNEVNVFTDDNVDFSTINLTKDHYLVIDPQGELTGINGQANPVEIGKPPKGDKGYVGHPNYVAGIEHELDDNRGVYKIISLEDNGDLTVSPVYKENTDSDWNFLPTVNGNLGGDLRITSPSDGSNSYLGNANSVENIKYTIYAKKDGVSSDTLEQVLFLRERTLSWSERVSNLAGVDAYNWNQYVSKEYVQYIGEGDITHPSNADLLIEGEVGVSPFLSNEYGLSILDRRVHVEDTTRLINEGYGDTGDGMPSLLEDSISSMGARSKRYSWIKMRTSQLNGTLPRLSRIDLDNIDSNAIEDLENE